MYIHIYIYMMLGVCICNTHAEFTRWCTWMCVYRTSTSKSGR